METIKLSFKGQVLIPKSLRESHHWQTGMEFAIEETAEGVLLCPLKPFKPTRHEDVFGCLKYVDRLCPSKIWKMPSWKKPD